MIDIAEVSSTATQRLIDMLWARFPLCEDVASVHDNVPEAKPVNRVLSPKFHVDVADLRAEKVGLVTRISADASAPVVFELTRQETLRASNLSRVALRAGVWLSTEAYMVSFFAYVEIYTKENA